MGPAAKDAAPALKKVVQRDKDYHVCREATEALKKIQPEQDKP